jgi:hypothetical protein
LDYIIDENPLKIGLYSPKMNIPIVDSNYFVIDKENKFVIIIFVVGCAFLTYVHKASAMVCIEALHDKIKLPKVAPAHCPFNV